ncbi:MAG: ATP-binding protein [Gammaproteobacteria bacterium]|nr:ATP-binding protein [Gammaproteobacteria bacterium]
MSTAPYPGLRPFERDEADIFFGREEHTDQLLAKLGETHFIAVLGPSGCGKSSLVRTGLLAGLESGFLAGAGARWQTAELRPGHRPFTRLAEQILAALGDAYLTHCHSLEQALNFLEADLRRGSYSLQEILNDTPFSPPDTNLLILIDQFEEIFRYFSNNDDAAAFVALLLAASEHDCVYVIITMRSEFLGDCALFYGLPEAINEGLYLTPRLTREQLQEAIEGPANIFDVEIEPGLSARLLNDVGINPDQLPLLQHVLMLLHRKIAVRDTTILKISDYEMVEGVEQALSLHGDEIFTKLTPKQQKISETLFRSLSEFGSEYRDIRRPISLITVAKLAGSVPWQEVAAVVNIFRQPDHSFLTPALPTELTPDTILDVSHESLIRHWEHSRVWAEKEIESATLYKRLEDSAYRWKIGETGLLRSPELEVMLKWCETEQPNATWAKRYGKKNSEYFDFAMNFLKISQEEQQKNDLENYQKLYSFVSILTKKQKYQNENISQSTVFLAEPSDDLVIYYDKVKHYLENQDMRILSIEKLSLSSGTEELENSLSQCDFFIQLLSDSSDNGYPQLQYEYAQNANLPTLQWRNRELDLDIIHDTNHRNLLGGSTVVASTFMEFLNYMVRKIQKIVQQERNDFSTEDNFVFINAAPEDIALSYEIQEILKEHEIESSLPILSADITASQTRQDLENNLLYCTGVIIVYGDVSVSWVRQQLMYCRRIQAQRKSSMKLIAVLDKISGGSYPLNIYLRNLHVFECRSLRDNNCVPLFIKELQI